MATLEDLRRRVLYMMEDPSSEGYVDEQITDAIASAFDAILPWISKTKSTAITGDGTATSFTLPSDFYDMEAVVVRETGLILPKVVFSPNLYVGENIDAENDWRLYPSGSISFSKTLESDEVYDLYYLASWTKPTSSTSKTSEMEPPEIATTGIVLYAAAYLILPGATSTASVRRFNTRVDSGNPEHNPMQKSVTFLLNLFQSEMNRLPKRAKGVV